jgi:hypothetical protein
MTATADPSQRFILPADAPLLANLAALWSVDPELAAAVEAVEDDTPYRVEPSNSGDPTASQLMPDGRRIYLHSRYNPREEAQRLIKETNLEKYFFYHLHGVGLGYHLDLLHESASPESTFCIFEADMQLLRVAFEARDMSRLIASKRVLFFTGLDKGGLFTRLTPHSPLITLGTIDVDHPVSLQRSPEFHAQLKAWLAEFASFARTNLNTLVLNGRKTLENIARNVGWFSATPGAERLDKVYAGKPSIIVSAGPSLRKNKHQLKALKGKAVIIAVQTTLQPLLEIGVEPDFVTALDYHDICSRFFERLPPTLKTELIVEPKATPAIFAMHPGPLTTLGNDLAESLLREMDQHKQTLRAGSTVAHLSYYLAEHMGCDPIIFIGQDLGFSDGLYYSPGTSYDDVWRPEFGRFCTPEMKQWEMIVRERNILRKINDNAGRPMYTEERLFTYLQQFERDFSQTTTRILDCTEGGAAKLGTTVMPLAEAASLYCREELAILANPPAADWSRTGEVIDCLKTRKAESDAMASISQRTLPLLEELRDDIQNQNHVNRLIAQIDLLRSEMNALGRTYDLVMQMAQDNELARFHADRKIAASKLRGVELQKHQVNRDIDNVRGVMTAAIDFSKLMDQVITLVQEQSQTPPGWLLQQPASLSKSA